MPVSFEEKRKIIEQIKKESTWLVKDKEKIRKETKEYMRKNSCLEWRKTKK